MEHDSTSQLYEDEVMQLKDNDVDIFSVSDLSSSLDKKLGKVILNEIGQDDVLFLDDGAPITAPIDIEEVKIPWPLLNSDKNSGKKANIIQDVEELEDDEVEDEDEFDEQDEEQNDIGDDDMAEFDDKMNLYEDEEENKEEEDNKEEEEEDDDEDDLTYEDDEEIVQVRPTDSKKGKEKMALKKAAKEEKRGRGRPPKDSTAVKDKKVKFSSTKEPKKGRGRPPKVESNGKRGRPPKAVKDDSSEMKRGRGRPPKIAVVDYKMPSSTGKRGRPRKEETPELAKKIKQNKPSSKVVDLGNNIDVEDLANKISKALSKLKGGGVFFGIIKG